MKRFYKKAGTLKGGNGHSVLLDDRCIQTPNKSELCAPTEKLAKLIAAEWDAQDDVINPDTMPLTQLLNTKIDRVLRDRADMETLVLNYTNTDLLCYRIDEPPELAQRQNQIWQPWLDWFEQKHGTAFQTTLGLAALKQAPEIHARLAEKTRDMSDDVFTIFQMLTPACGSVVLALAFIDRAASVQDILDCAYLEENYKYDLYNEDVHGGDPLTEKKKKSLKFDLDAAEIYLNALAD